jgi:hypothetical protein
MEPPWLISIVNDENFRDHPGYLLIGGKIEVRNCLFTFYSFSLCIVINGKIARRFHFDIDTGNGKATKPQCHMQYGGEAHELNFNPGLDYSLHPWMEKPRLPFPPLDIVLLLDFTLAQINTSLGPKFTKEANWKNLVKNSEKLRLKEYYDQIYQYLGNSDNDKLTLFEKLCS